MTDLVNNGYAGYQPCNIGVPPDDAPKIIAFNGIQLAAGIMKRLDFRDLIETGVINTLQSIYIDNDTASRVIIQVDGASQHRIIALANTQGWYPIPLADNIGITLLSPGNVAINLALANVNIIAGPWKTA